MNFIKGLIDTIRQGQLIIKINQEGKSYIDWYGIFNMLIGFPIFMYILICIVSTEQVAFADIISTFFTSYFALFVFSVIFRVLGISYLGTYKYIFNYIFNKNR